MWFTETPWPPIFLFTLIGCGLLVAWYSQKRAVYLAGALLTAVLAAGTYVVEQWIVTESEGIEQLVYDLTGAFQRRDREQLLSYFSIQEPGLRLMADSALAMVTVSDDLTVKDLSVTMRGENSLGVAQFRANASINVRGVGDCGFQPSRWRITWRKEADDWKISKVTRMHPLKEEELGLLEKASY